MALNPPIPADEAIAAIGDQQLELLAACQREGWDRWLEIRSTRAGILLSTSARARIVYDATVARARATFDQAMCGSQRGFLILDFGRVMVRFKKLDEDLAPRGIPTGQALMFEDQAHLAVAQLTMWPPAPMLIAGYVLDSLGTGFVRQVLIMRQAGQVIWERDLPGATSAGGQLVPGPSPTTPPAPAEVRPARRPEEDQRTVAE